MALEDVVQAAPAPFTWSAGGGQLTPEEIAARRKVAAAMMQEAGDYSPIRSAWQGAARAAKGLVAGLENRQTNQAEAANAAAQPKMIADMLASYQAANAPQASAVSPSVATVSAALPAVVPAPGVATTGKIYSNDEPSPLDPPSGQDRTNMIATILGEENTPQGQGGVANVIRNRAIDGSYGGNSPTSVVQAPSQFEPWATDAGRARMAAALNDPKQVAAANAAINGAYGEGGKAPTDPTEGATLFYAPGAQAALGRPAPSWAKGEGTKLGSTMFYDDNDASPAKPVQVASNDPSAIPVNAAPAQGTLPSAEAVANPAVAKVTSALGNVNPAVLAAYTSPYASESTKKIAGLLLQSQLTPKEVHTQETDAKGNVWDVNKQTGQKTVALKTDTEADPKWGIIGKDQYGQPTYGYAPTRTEYAATKSATASAPPSDQPDLTNVHGKEYMDALGKSDPKYASQVTAILEGRAPYPTGMLLKTPYGQRLAQDVTQADPSFESGNATARVNVRNEFEKGGVSSPAGQITAGNTAIQHAGEMSDSLERMKSHPGMAGLGEAGIPFVSYYANKFHNAAVQGTPEGKDLNDFMTAKNHFSEEVTKFYAGSAGSEAERARALANIDAAKSLPELRSAIKTEANLMQGKVNALQNRWRTGMGPLVPDFPLIHPESQAAIDRVRSRDASSEAPSAGSAPSAAVAKLAQNPTPEMKAHFDEVFGAGSADKALAK